MTCRTANGKGGCGYEFCWECAGPYHTTSGCSNPKTKAKESNSSSFQIIENILFNAISIVTIN
jgi:hypothetical protein